MLKERIAHLPGDIGYILDAACEEHEILGCHHYALNAYGDTAILDEIVNRERTARVLRGRRQMTAEICDYANEIIAQMPEWERGWVANMAHAHARKIVSDYADHLASWNFEDSTIGGCAKPYRDRVCMRKDGTPSPKALRRLCSPKAIRRYVRLYDGIDHLVAPLKVLGQVPLPRDLKFGAAAMQEIEERIMARRDVQYAAMRDIMERNRAILPKTPKQIRMIKESRKVVKRAAVLASALLGASTVAAFAKGEPVRLSGQQIDFEIAAPSGLAAMGHGGVKIKLLDKGGHRLAGLCVYHEGTPALDQLTAFALRVNAGEEEDIITTGNLYQVTSAGADHKLLKRKPEPAPEIAYPDARWAGSRSPQFQARKAEYLAKFLPIYREAIALRLRECAAEADPVEAPKPAPPPAVDPHATARAQGFTGDVCPDCGNYTMVRNGSCLKCQTCGSTTGCS